MTASTASQSRSAASAYGSDAEANRSISMAADSVTGNTVQTSQSTEVQQVAASKLCFRLDEIGQLARFGRNATLKQTSKIPKDILKSDIHVIVDIDEPARVTNPSQERRKEEQMILDSIRDDLQSVYTATAESAKVFLVIVIVLLEDGSLSNRLSDSEGVPGLVELAVAWRLFHGDDLTVYQGGLVVQSEDSSYHIQDIHQSRGQKCLTEILAPKIANDIMSRIGNNHSYDLLAEF